MAEHIKKRPPVKHLSDLVSDVLSDVIARRSGMTLDLLAAWDDIVGEQYANVTLPEKILWPKSYSDDDAFQAGTLVVACDGSRVLFFQHESTQIIERLNLFFGFQAIAKLKLIQRPINRQRQKVSVAQKLNREEAERLNSVLNKINDPELRKRLEKFGKGVISKNSKPA